MSLKSVLAKIINHIESIFDKIRPDLKRAIHVAVNLVENIKGFVDSPAADVLTAIIPGDLDDKIKKKLREELPKILIRLKLAENCSFYSGGTNYNEIVKCAIKTIQSMDGDIKSAYLHNISILIAQIAADGRLTWSDGVYFLQWYYERKYKA